MTKNGNWLAMVDLADQGGYKDYIALNKASSDGSRTVGLVDDRSSVRQVNGPNSIRELGIEGHFGRSLHRG